jgi:hypothetical protein
MMPVFSNVNEPIDPESVETDTEAWAADPIKVMPGNAATAQRTNRHLILHPPEGPKRGRTFSFPLACNHAAMRIGAMVAAIPIV